EHSVAPDLIGQRPEEQASERPDKECHREETRDDDMADRTRILRQEDHLDDDREIDIDAEVVPFCDDDDVRGPDRSPREIGPGPSDLVRAPPPTDIVRSEHVFTFRWRA